MDPQPDLFGLDNGMAHRLERSACAGNGVVPLAAAYAWRTLRAAFD
jgi:DNA (cytosine-5)-methyltransferase 1